VFEFAREKKNATRKRVLNESKTENAFLFTKSVTRFKTFAIAF